MREFLLHIFITCQLTHPQDTSVHTHTLTHSSLQWERESTHICWTQARAAELSTSLDDSTVRDYGQAMRSELYGKMSVVSLLLVLFEPSGLDTLGAQAFVPQQFRIQASI